VNRLVKPDYYIKITLKGISKDQFNDYYFPKTIDVFKKYQIKFAQGTGKINEFEFSKYHAKEKDSRMDDYIFNYGARTTQSGELSLENLVYLAKDQGYITAKVKNYCDPEEVWGLMNDMMKTDYNLDSPFCDENCFFPDRVREDQIYRKDTQNHFNEQTNHQSKIMSFKEFLIGPKSPYSLRIYNTHALSTTGQYIDLISKLHKRLFMEIKLATPFNKNNIFPYILPSTMKEYDRIFSYHLN
jgi:hypothetical protein